MTTPITVQSSQPGDTINVTFSPVGDRGPQGDPGPATTLAIGTVASGEEAAAALTGTAPAQTLNLTLPIGPQGEQGIQGIQGIQGATGATGPANSLAVGTVTTGAAGSNASASVTGAAPSQTLNLTIPRGDTGATGPTNSLAVGTVTTGAAGSNASATITGAAPSQTLNLTIPRGATGTTGATGATGPANSLTIGTVSGGSTAAATITGFTPNQTLNLTLPTGATGATGAVGPRGAAGKGNDTVFVVKPSDDFVEGADPLMGDGDLLFQAAANSTYLVTMAWVFDEEAGRSQWSLSLPAGASIVQALHQFAGPDDYKPEYHLPAAPNLPLLTLPFVPEAGKSNDGVNTLIAVIQTGETAGLVEFEFAQVAASATGGAAVKGGSWLRAELVIPDPAAVSDAPTTAGVNVAAPDANVTLTTTSKRYQFLAPTTSINLVLPAITSANEGLSFVIKNEDTSYVGNITVKDASDATITTVFPYSAAEVVSTGSAWKVVPLSSFY